VIWGKERPDNPDLLLYTNKHNRRRRRSFSTDWAVVQVQKKKGRKKQVFSHQQVVDGVDGDSFFSRRIYFLGLWLEEGNQTRVGRDGMIKWDNTKEKKKETPLTSEGERHWCLVTK
jgi:hypothetical protein